MFSGIIEGCEPIEAVRKEPEALRIDIKKPSDFNDLNIGDSVAVNGVCLTVEAFDEEKVTFALAAETLQVLKLNPDQLLGQRVNLERSMKLGDRVHGHFVTGHVDARARLQNAYRDSGSLILEIEMPKEKRGLLWEKGSVALNGVSLTVNSVKEDSFSVCLIPETLKRTNLESFAPGDELNFEADYFAKAVQNVAVDRGGKL